MDEERPARELPHSKHLVNDSQISMVRQEKGSDVHFGDRDSVSPSGMPFQCFLVPDLHLGTNGNN